MSADKGPILITGAAGVVGSNAVKQLVAQGVPVAAADAVASPGVLLRGFESVPYHRLDIRDFALLMEVIQKTKPSVIVHLAALVGEWYNEHPHGNHEVNVGGTINVFEAARLSGVSRVVFASTWSFYPQFRGTKHGHPTYEPVPEDTPPHPVRPYEISKYTIERYAYWYRQLHGLEFAALRFGAYYAAERRVQAGGRSVGAINDLLLAVGQGQPYRVKEGGDQGFDAVYVKDCAGAAVAAALAKATPSGSYNIGNGRAVNLHDVAGVVRELVPGAVMEIGPGLLPAKHNCALDITRARTELGYEPKYPLREGIADWLKEYRRLDEVLRG